MEGSENMSIKENLKTSNFDLDVIEIGNIDKNINYKTIKPTLKNIFISKGYLVCKNDNTKEQVVSYFELKGDFLEFIIHIVNDIFVYSKLNIITDETEVEISEVMMRTKPKDFLNCKEATIGLADSVMSHFCYANYLANIDKKIIYNNTQRIARTGKSKGTKKKAKKKVIRKINLSNITKRATSQSKHDNKDKREYNRQAESWTVRGHYRHYKSGKVVWINAQTRGHGKVEHKTYTIGG